VTDRIKINREEELTVPSSERMMVDIGDWARLRRHLGQLTEPLGDHSMTWAATAVGAGVGLSATVVVLEKTESHVEAGVIPSLWIAVAFSLLFGLCFSLVSRSSRKRHGIDIKAICEDMDDVADRLGHEGLGIDERGADGATRSSEISQRSQPPSTDGGSSGGRP
jgi:hypothetical protein